MADVDSAVGLVSAINVATGEGLGVTAFVSGVGEVGGLRSAELAGAVVTLNLKDGSKIYLNPSALSAVKSGTRAD
jgi:uncharacterized protein (AIM24 family)